MQKLQISDLLKSFNGKPEVEGVQNTQSVKASKATEQFLTDKTMKVKKIKKNDEILMKRKYNYQATQQDMDKWLGIVKVNREKDTLDLTKKQKDGVKINFFPSKPVSTLQAKTDKALNKLSLQNQSTVMKAEEQQLSKMDPEEAKRRLSEARKHRTTIFYQQQKNKRIAKIKSKVYHRIKKRQKLREQHKRLQTMNPHEKNEYYEKLTKQRIKERIDLRHNTKNKHIQNLLRFNKFNKDGVQEAINEVNQIRKKQLERKDDQINSELFEDMSEEYDDENYREQAKEDLEKELANLQQRSDSEDEQAGGNCKKQGLDTMKFMRVASEKKKEKDINDAYRLINQLENQEDSAQIVASDEEDSQNGQLNHQALKKSSNKQTTRKVFGADELNEKTPFYSQNKPKGQFIKKNITNALNYDPENLIEGIDVNNLKEKYQPKRADLKLNEELIEQNRELFNMEQEENEAVIDNVRDFYEDKQANYVEQVEPEKKRLHGWGNWAGPSIKEKKVDPTIEIKKKLAKIEEIKRKRRDGELSHVIINEVRNKNLKEYMVRKLPHEYSNADQFEYMNKQSVGPEWNSLTQFKSNIKPRVITKKGEVIEPIKVPRKITKLQQNF